MLEAGYAEGRKKLMEQQLLGKRMCEWYQLFLPICRLLAREPELDPYDLYTVAQFLYQKSLLTDAEGRKMLARVRNILERNSEVKFMEMELGDALSVA